MALPEVHDLGGGVPKFASLYSINRFLWNILLNIYIMVHVYQLTKSVL